MHASVRDNPVERRYEIPIAKDVIAAVYYRLQDGIVVRIHTEVPFEYSGNGIGTRLAILWASLQRQSQANQSLQI